MTLNIKYFIFLAFIFFSCSQQTITDRNMPEEKALIENVKATNQLLLDKLEIPKSWTEITSLNNKWVYSIPCHNYRELQTVDIRKNGNQESVMWNWGTGGQWHILNKIINQGDSLIFETLLPYDTSEVVIFTFKYIDKEKNIVRWGADGTYCNYIPTKDTSKYERIQQPCDKGEVEDEE